MIEVAIAKVLSSKFYGYDPNPTIVWLEHVGETPDGDWITYYDFQQQLPDGSILLGLGQKDAPMVVRHTDKPHIDRGAAFAAADDDYFDRCQSRNPKSSPWAIEVSAASAMLRTIGVRSRCTLPAGHAGDHIGPDDVTWPQGQEEPDV